MDPRQIPAIDRGFRWLEVNDGKDFLSQEEHCRTRDVFEVRLERMRREMKKDPALENIYSLVNAIAGEFGNNAFDHNLGNWPDEPGIYFVYDLKKRFFIIADRGQGIFATLRTVKSDLKDDRDALEVAFRLPISARSLEHRGNGLKFVKRVIEQKKDFSLSTYSGNGQYHIVAGEAKSATLADSYRGVLAVVFF